MYRIYWGPTTNDRPTSHFGKFRTAISRQRIIRIIIGLYCADVPFSNYSLTYLLTYLFTRSLIYLFNHTRIFEPCSAAVRFSQVMRNTRRSPGHDFAQIIRNVAHPITVYSFGAGCCSALLRDNSSSASRFCRRSAMRSLVWQKVAVFTSDYHKTTG